MTKKFPGFPEEPATNYWPYPKALNSWWHKLTGSEQKVLDYILRHTWGFKKIQDTISYKQFVKGIKTKDGKWFDKGTGLSEPTVSKAIKGLIKKGFVEVQKGTGGMKKREVSEYRLKFLKQTSEPSRLKKVNLSSLSDNKRDITIKDNNKRLVKKRKKYSSIKDIVEEDLIEIAQKYRVPLAFVKLQLEALKNYCESKGRRYKNYKAALRNFVISAVQRTMERSNQDGRRQGVDARDI